MTAVAWVVSWTHFALWPQAPRRHPCARLLQLDAGHLHERRPALVLGRNERRKLLGRAATDHVAGACDFLPGIGQGQRVVVGLVEFADDGGRQPLGPDQLLRDGGVIPSILGKTIAAQGARAKPAPITP